MIYTTTTITTGKLFFFLKMSYSQAVFFQWNIQFWRLNPENKMKFRNYVSMKDRE